MHSRQAEWNPHGPECIPAHECKILVHCSAAALSVQVEIGVVRHVCNGCLVAHTGVNDADCILLCQLISNRNFEFSRIAILSIRTDPGKSNCILSLYCRCIPQFLLKSVRAAVEIVLAFVWRQFDLCAIQHKSGICDTVAASADACSEKASIYKIALKIIVSKDYVCQSAILIRHADIHQDRTIL